MRNGKYRDLKPGQIKLLPVEERFWLYVNRSGPNECWPWAGALTRGGYGKIRTDNKSWLAHRMAYKLTFGDFPKNLKIRHTCDNPACCNPAHLLTGTQKDNMDDMYARNRNRHQRGEEHHQSKLTECDVRAIRRSKKSRRELAAYYNVSDVTISNVRLRKKWRHVV